MRGIPTLLLLALSATLSCGGNGSSFSGADSDGHVRQGAELTGLPPHGFPHLALIAVDDAPTAEARGFRGSLALGFRRDYTSSRAFANESCAQPRDPAAPDPVQEYAIVLAPSATGQGSARTFVDDPTLAWLAPERLDADAASWSVAVAGAIEATETTNPGPYHPLAALEHWVQLLAHEASPAGELEQAVVDALPAHVDVETFFASSRADDDPRSADRYQLQAKENCTTGKACVDPLQSFDPARKLFDLPLIADCRSRCMDTPIRDELSGAVECRVLVATYHPDDCAGTPGWTEPTLDAPKLKQMVQDAPGFRICEIEQLQGGALDSCVNDLDCADCMPGFCATRVPELLGDCSRSSTPTPWPFRFPGMPSPLEQVWLDTECNFGD